MPIVAIFLSCSIEKSSVYSTRSSTNCYINGLYPSIFTLFSPAIVSSGFVNRDTSMISKRRTFRKTCFIGDLYLLIAVFIAKSRKLLSCGAASIRA